MKIMQYPYTAGNVPIYENVITSDILYQIRWVGRIRLYYHYWGKSLACIGLGDQTPTFFDFTDTNGFDIV